ncbi:MAG TPA: hypothetical protein VHB77_17210, partial [Planctomycetaceae bacterium]|nr:hypothetical protein [Planctomycetaceae bacterium]
MLVWQTGLPDLHGQETPPKAIATTSADRQVSGWIEGRSPRDLHFHTSAQAVSLKQIHRVLWDVGTLRLPEPPARRVLLSGGEALIAPCLGATESSLRLHWPGDREFELPLSGVEAIANPPGGTPLYYEDFEHLPIAWRCADDAKPVLDRAHSTSGERSLRWPAQACVLERVPEALSAGKVEFHFYDPGEVVAGVRCVCQFTFETRLGQQRLRAVLGADAPRYSLETPDHSALTRQELRRRPGWHRFSLEWDAERTLALIDRDVLASGPALAGVLQAVSLNRSATGNANDNADAPLWIDDFSIQKPGVFLPLPTNSRELDVAVLMSGDEIFGDWLGSTQREFSLRTPFGEWTTPWSKLRGVVLRTRPSAGKPIQGWICRVEFPSTSPVAPVDALVVALQSAD